MAGQQEFLSIFHSVLKLPVLTLPGFHLAFNKCQLRYKKLAEKVLFCSRVTSCACFVRPRAGGTLLAAGSQQTGLWLSTRCRQPCAGMSRGAGCDSRSSDPHQQCLLAKAPQERAKKPVRNAEAAHKHLKSFSKGRDVNRCITIAQQYLQFVSSDQPMI